MPPLKPAHISPTPEETASIDAAIANDPDTREVTGPLVRLDTDVVERLRADGPGWQTRANAALREAVLGK